MLKTGVNPVLSIATIVCSNVSQMDSRLTNLIAVFFIRLLKNHCDVSS